MGAPNCWWGAFLVLAPLFVGANVPCGFPGAPAHSRVDINGSWCYYYCERGFELLGPSRRFCDRDGHWKPDGIPFCVLNVAAGKAPMQISTLLGGVPQRAVDGSTLATFSSDTCTLTKPENLPWWYVNLLEPYMVQLVRLDFGKPCCGDEEATIVVRVGNNRPDLGTNPVCNRYTDTVKEGQPLFLPCNPPMPGAFVSVHLEGPRDDKQQLSICEAFVYTDQALPIERCPQFRDQPPGTTATYNGKCYVFYSHLELNFNKALAFCRARGGTLVDESNPALQGFISWELYRRHRSDSSSQYWMGVVRDHNDRNNWKWLNGENVTVSFWNLPLANDDCARYDGTKGWLWSDTNCHAQLNFICQHQPKSCGRPEQPPNSTMSAANFDVGANVEYSCDAGHLLVGPTTRTCLDTGFYNDFPPLCKRIECGYPADIPNGGYQLINGSVGYLSHVVYTCEEGYELIGRAKLTCDIDERWNGPPPRCEPIQCETPAQIVNGKYASNVNDTSFGSIIEYFCLRGYTLYGAKRAVCLANGQWDNPPPLCKPDEVLTTLSSTSRPLITKSFTRPTRPSSSTSSRTTSTTTTTTQRSIINNNSNNNNNNNNKRPNKKEDSDKSSSAYVPRIIVAAHPSEKHSVGGNNNLNQDPLTIERDVPGGRDTLQAKLNTGAIIALGAFGGFVFLAAIVTTIVILVRRNRHSTHYRHRVSPDCNTVASFDSSSSESRNGLNRYYRQAWENLHESQGPKTALGLKRHPSTLEQGLRDGSELVVSDNNRKMDKRRHHHHHHHHDLQRHKEWKNARPNHNHKQRY